MARAMVDSAPRRQFDLLTVFEWMLLVGLFFAALAGGRSARQVAYTVAEMPADDSELKQWYLEEAGLNHVEIMRGDKGLVIHVQQSPLSSLVNRPVAPFDSLGYKGISRNNAQSTSFLGMPTLSLAIGVALLLAIRLVRRKTGVRQAGDKNGG